MSDECFFCRAIREKAGDFPMESENFVARMDDFAISKGHCEILPKKHIESFLDLTDDQVLELYSLIKKMKKHLDDTLHPDAYNFGCNEGRAAGRTIDHFHYHIIPRYLGDVPNPRGGIRNIIAEKGNYSGTIFDK